MKMRTTAIVAMTVFMIFVMRVITVLFRMVMNFAHDMSATAYFTGVMRMRMTVFHTALMQMWMVVINGIEIQTSDATNKAFFDYQFNRPFWKIHRFKPFSELVTAGAKIEK